MSDNAAAATAGGGVLDDEFGVQLFKRYLQVNTAHPLPQYREAVDLLRAHAEEFGLEMMEFEVCGLQVMISVSVKPLYDCCCAEQKPQRALRGRPQKPGRSEEECVCARQGR